MTIRDILKMGDPRLLRTARPVPLHHAPFLPQLLQDLRDTMAHAHGAGLAAPQIGEDWQVVVFGSGLPNPRYPDAPIIPPTVLINPTLTPLDDTMADGWEGCLSVPGLRGVVPRHPRIRYTGWDEHLQPIDRTVDGFHARVVQHECDHLWGRLYPTRMTDLTQLGFTEVLFPELAAPAPEASPRSLRRPIRRVYLAGPDVFYPDATARGEAMKALCADHGFEGAFPLDNVIAPDQPELARAIFEANRQMLDGCDAVLANLRDWRGPEPDSGTVWEAAYAIARGKPVIGYRPDATPMRDRLVTLHPASRHTGTDANGHAIEDFGAPLNLMLTHSLSGLAIGSETDLAGLRVALQQLRQLAGTP